ncbi:S-methyl-5-thioadenosine phosphorylase [Schizosaccharomyces japonicus yFS275]|uniref:S-methyl-5'-thioadenosine phosphorylase n=1 Tax=Schizosaccharomyces japonicus (strain yFS275 / FY16936) TaxID=402676 RepID=B6K5B1_SCHJY|nr:S-methyl-5-thioadenosine phosphorylase [Schizosaccharomyces japonicus yFS275]EEB08715.1 S-methyl-5-thioadenosine phosphorylase [Schizosaccharomyces japonicus yFS275]
MVHNVLLGVIGGSGFYELSGFEHVKTVNPETPWGFPSSPINIVKSKTGLHVAFLARHGVGHRYTPTEIPVRANIAALKSLGVQAILAFSAVGSLREEIPPEDFVLPNQIIDRTLCARPNTFFPSGCVAHVSFGDPFDADLARIVAQCAGALERGAKLHVPTVDHDLTVVCMEGPAFSTRAESKLYRSWGASVINMSVIPEAKLAREAEIAYQMVCMATDYDCWRKSERPVTVNEVMTHLSNNTDNAKQLLTQVIKLLEPELRKGSIGETLRGAVQHGIQTNHAHRDPAVVGKLRFLFPSL